MSGSESDWRWKPLLVEMRAEVQKSIGSKREYNELQDRVHDRKTFRESFEKFCKNKNEVSPDRIQSRMMWSYESILDLAQAVDKSSPDLKEIKHKDGLESLVWKVSFALIVLATRAFSQVRLATDLATELNKTIPQFSKQKLEFPEKTSVQQHVHKVLRGYIDVHLSIFTQLYNSKNMRSWKDMEELESFIRVKTQSFEISRGAYVQAVNLAAQNREIGKLSAKDAATIAREGKEDSLIHPGSGANREVPVMFVSQARLGGGSFGEVDIVQEISTGVVYARKHIHFGHRDGTTVSRETVKNEVVAMQSLHHRHIASVLFYIVDKEGCSIFMLPVAEQNLREYLEGCVQSRFEAGRTKPITGWFGCLLDALAFAHAEGIYHRDIKPSNILIKGTKPYLTDFGLAKVVGPDDSSTSSGIDVHGTMAYRAPEVRPGFVRHNGKPDVFSLGCTFSEMVTVTEKLSLADYIKMRNGRAFRECLSDVEKWLCDMKQNRNSRLIEMIVDETLDMMSADADKRPAASQSVNSLKRDRAFWCVEENPRHP